jgi:hypothetical protein
MHVAQPAYDYLSESLLVEASYRSFISPGLATITSSRDMLDPAALRSFGRLGVSFGFVQLVIVILVSRSGSSGTISV